MVVGSKILHKEPTSRWFALGGLLTYIFAADQIVNRQWHAEHHRGWNGTYYDSSFYVAGGIVLFLFATLLTVLGFARWSALWFE